MLQGLRDTPTPSSSHTLQTVAEPKEVHKHLETFCSGQVTLESIGTMKRTHDFSLSPENHSRKLGVLLLSLRVQDSSPDQASCPTHEDKADPKDPAASSKGRNCQALWTEVDRERREGRKGWEEGREEGGRVKGRKEGRTEGGKKGRQNLV